MIYFNRESEVYKEFRFVNISLSTLGYLGYIKTYNESYYRIAKQPRISRSLHLDLVENFKHINPLLSVKKFEI